MKLITVLKFKSYVTFLKKQFEIQKYRRLWKLVIQHKMLLLLYFVLHGLNWKDNWFWISKEMWLFLNFKSSLGKKWEKELVTVKTELVRDIYKPKLFNKVISKHYRIVYEKRHCIDCNYYIPSPIFALGVLNWKNVLLN